MIGFILGAIAGGAAMWLYGNEIRTYVDDKTKTARSKAADSLKTVAQTIEEGSTHHGQNWPRESSTPGSTGSRSVRESIG